MNYPFDWSAWWRYHCAVARAQGGLRAVREATVRALLGLASGIPWSCEPDAELPRDALMVVGHQRSGTTWLHRLLAAHPDATALPLHGLLLPADAWQRWFDRPRPGWLDRLQDALLGPLDDLHRLRLHEPEEDEFALWAVFRSPMNGLDRPWPAQGAPEIEPGEEALRFYAQAIARQVRRTGRRYVGKNPHFTWRIPALRRALPGVRLVACWRHPEVAIASRLSLIREIWRRRRVAQELEPHDVERIYASSVRCYLGGLDQAEIDIRYDDLVADPLGTVRFIHRALELEPVQPEALAPLLARGQGRHRYGLEAFGLEAERIRSDLAPVYERFGFEPLHRAGSALSAARCR